MCGFSLNMVISTLVCNVDGLDIFHFLRRSRIDWELEMHTKLSSKFPCILALLWEQSKQNCPELPVQIFDFSIFLKCLRQLDGGWNFIKKILTLCYKAVNGQLVFVDTAEMSSTDCATNCKFFACSQLPWDDVVGFFFSVPCWLAHKRKCFQTMFV